MTFFLKNKIKFYFNYNLSKLMKIDVTFFLLKTDYLFNHNFLFKLTKVLYKYYYNFIFFNFKLNNLIINNSFYKNIFINFNKNSLFFYNCVNNFVFNKFIFSKFLDESFFLLIIKNYKKLYRQFNFNKFNKKNAFLSKINFFRLSKFNKKLELFNSNTAIYFFITKTIKTDFFLEKNSKFFSTKKVWFFFSNIYCYSFKNNNKIDEFFKKYNFVKFHNLKNYFFNDFYYNLLICENEINFIYLNKNIFFNLKNNKINFNYSNIWYFYKNLKYKSNILNLYKHNFFFKKNNYLNTRIKNLQNYFLNKYILKSLLILNDRVHDYNNDFQFFFSSIYLFNTFNNFFTPNLNNDSENSIILNNYKFYNNHYPIFFIKNNFVDFFSSKIKQTNKLNIFKYIQFYLIGFFENLLKKKIFVKSLSSSQLGYYNYERLEFLFEEFKFNQLKIVKGLHTSEILEVIWLSFQNKDTYLFMTWLKKRMEKIHFKNHKKFLNLLKLIITKYSYVFLESFRLKGFFFDIRGKVGVGGNSKKRHFFFRIGKINLSSKNSKIDHQQNIVNTSFGALGVTMILSY